MLTACGASGIPPLPADLATCFDKTVPAPEPGALTAERVFRLIGDLKASETQKAQCGHRMVSMWKGMK